MSSWFTILALFRKLAKSFKLTPYNYFQLNKENMFMISIFLWNI